jgi:hypothetical protein
MEMGRPSRADFVSFSLENSSKADWWWTCGQSGATEGHLWGLLGAKEQQLGERTLGIMAMPNCRLPSGFGL